MADKIEVFISSSGVEEDEELRDRLEQQLATLDHLGLLNVWHIGKVIAGDERHREIDKHLSTAHIILLLISPSFIASRSCYNIIMQAMDRHAAGKSRVIPVILRPVTWEETRLGSLQPLPMNGKPVTVWKNRDEAFLEIIQGIRRVIDQLMSPVLENFEFYRKSYTEYLIDKYKHLDLTGLSVPGYLDEKQLLLEHLFVTPLLKHRKGEQTVDVSISQIIAQTQCSVIFGDLGSGKTALLQYLTLIFAKGDAERKLGLTTNFLPLLIPLREYVSKRPSSNRETLFPFLSYLYIHLAKLDLQLPEGFFEHYLSRGECLILFDGVDEIVKFSERNEVRELIFNFVDLARRRHPRNRIVITARPPQSQHPTRDDVQLYTDRFNHFFLSPFTWSQITQFANAWYTLREQSSVQVIKEKTQNLLLGLKKSRALSLTTNPLYLTNIALFHSQKGELPNRRVKLYDQVTEAVLMRDRWKGLLDELDEFDEELKRTLLGRVAFWMQSQPQESTHDELRRKLILFLKKEENLDIIEARHKAALFIDWAVNRGNLLTVAENDIYGFKHQTFQEYFAAYDIYRNYINTLRRSLKVISDIVMTHLHDTAWSEVILFLVSLLTSKPATEIVNRVLKGTEYHNLYPRDLLMILRFLGQEVRISRELQDKILNDLWQKCFWERPEVSWRSGLWRKFCQDVLSILPEIQGSSCEDKVVDRLMITLHDERPIIRAMAIEWIGQIGTPNKRVVAVLIESLQDKDPSVQDKARRALTKLGQDYEEVIEELEKITADEGQSLPLRTHTARALMHLYRAYPLTLKVVLQGLLRPSDVHVVKEWIGSLLQEKKRAEERQREVVELLEPMLVQALESDSALVQSQGAQIVGKSACSSDSIVVALIKASKSENALVREKACWALGELGPKDIAVKASLAVVKDVLGERLQDNDQRASEAARKALKKLEE